MSASISDSSDNSSILGQGGNSSLSIKPELVQETAFMSHNPVSESYITETTGKRGEIVEYTVQPGDALSFIASDYGVTMNSIIWANNLKNADSISPGQVLRIPPVSGVIHKVAKGDTVSSISKRYNITEDQIISYNTLPLSGDLSIGEEIIIPGGTKTATGSVIASNQPRFSHLPDLGGFFMAPTTGYNWNTIHGRNGIDIANTCGTPIYAAAEGTVNGAYLSGYNGGYGIYIKISHPNQTETLYAHLSKILIKEGDSVSKGELIALMGTTGRSTGCHLHFEVHGAKNPLKK